MRILVCGSGGGIGAACVAQAERDGHQVMGVDRDTVDITRPGGAEKAIASAAERLGGLDGIVHAIGMSGRSLGDGKVSECTDEAWAEVHRVNLESVFRLLRAALSNSVNETSIVIVGSALASTLDEDFLTAAYAVSKSAIETLARAAAFEGAPRGIRVNVVAPGLVETPMARRALSDPHLTGRLERLMPLGAKACTPEEVAGAVAWLLSPASSRITGAVIPVDGGWNLR